MLRRVRCAAAVLLCVASPPAWAEVAPEAPAAQPAAAPAAPPTPPAAAAAPQPAPAAPAVAAPAPAAPSASAPPPGYGASSAAPPPGYGPAPATAMDVPLPPPPAGTTLQPVEPAAAKPPAPAAPGEPQVSLDPDRRGAVAMTVTQDLESDKTRQAWADAGGVLTAFDGTIGMTMLYKDLTKEAGKGSYMQGAGLNAGLRVALLLLDAPKYESGDKSWFAVKLGGGFDLSSMNVTVHTPRQCIGSTCFGGDEKASMAQTAVVGTLGFMTATGGFTSPTEWSGYALSLEWAPSQVKTVLTDSRGHQTSSSATNAAGFAFGVESGSLQQLSLKLASKARLKFRIFMLPATGDMPLFVSMAVGAVWY